jgi:hypothetical protein
MDKADKKPGVHALLASQHQQFGRADAVVRRENSLIEVWA